MLKIPRTGGFRTSIARRSSAVSQDVHEIALEISDIQDRFRRTVQFPSHKNISKTCMKVGTGDSSFVTQRWGTTSSPADVYPASLAWMTTFWFHMIIAPSIEQHQKLESMMAVWTFYDSDDSLWPAPCRKPSEFAISFVWGTPGRGFEDGFGFSREMGSGHSCSQPKNWCASVAYCKLQVNHDQSTCDYRL